MDFIVERLRNVTHSLRNTIVLTYDNWNDYGFYVLFRATYYNAQGASIYLGELKIAELGQSKDVKSVDILPHTFKKLDKRFVSLWQSAGAYEEVKKVEEENEEEIFKSLNDLALEPDKIDEYILIEVVSTALFRGIPPQTCKEQFHRIANGGDILTSYIFNYIERYGVDGINDFNIEFSVTPKSLPPTNIHVLIGPNGVGKTRLLNKIVDATAADIIQAECAMDSNSIVFSTKTHFASMVHVSFSPFDVHTNGIKTSYYSFIGNDNKEIENGDVSKRLRKKFSYCLESCARSQEKVELIDEAVKLLRKSFAIVGYEIERLRDLMLEESKSEREKWFNELSSGHKAILTIIICCIDQMQEKSLLVMDEPENHLHPPMISALIRVLSQILIRKNAVAIIASHSPVVVQEIPKSCVWIINRPGTYMNAHRPSLETFGTNVGVLTNEIFKYEVDKTGFQKMLSDAVEKYNSYEEILNVFNYQLGDEARSILRIMLYEKGKINE